MMIEVVQGYDGGGRRWCKVVCEVVKKGDCEDGARGCYVSLLHILSIRLSRIIGNLIGGEQSAFIKGRSILDIILIANELVVDVNRRKAKCFIFKADFEKAFDSIRWRFLLDIMSSMGFGIKWRRWMEACFKSASISVLVNGSPTKEFNLQRGIRQGDPLSPYLFIIASEGLNILANIAVRDHLIRGVELGIDKVIVSHLQFVDDTIFFGKWGKRNVNNVYKTLSCFEKVSGLKINMNKSFLYGIGVPHSEVESVALSLGCIAGKLPFLYLGMPIGHKMNKISAWDMVIDKFNKRLSDWKARTMSFGGRLTLIKSVLSSLPLYFFSLFRAPSTVINQLESIRLWRDISRLNVDSGKLGINIETLFERRLGDGSNILFWEDDWVGNVRLKDMFSRLYRIETNVSASIKDRVILVNGNWNFSWEWSRGLTGRLHGELDQLVSLIRNNAILEDGISTWRFTLGSNGEFSTRGRLPVRQELDKKGIDLDSLLCPMCNNIVESVDHALVSCKAAKEVWEGVFKWCGFDLPANANLENLFVGLGSGNISGHRKRIWQAIEWVTGYSIWKNRNSKVFRNAAWASSKVINEIQVKSYEWIRNRSKDSMCEWLQWLTSPFSVDSNSIFDPGYELNTTHARINKLSALNLPAKSCFP
ncbi:uncharacterized protein [Rutidosis leptorrhynchoides]|uniref:uncharacterized protein n=1 Tax=Rutidosis leptorrhynchoides TaxID=125765 RepID=UPI003A997494